MRVFGHMENRMVKGNICFLMDLLRQEFGKREIELLGKMMIKHRYLNN